MVLVANVLVQPQVKIVRVEQKLFRSGTAHVIVEEPSHARGRRRYVLEPRRSQRVHHPRVGGADDVGGLTVTPHELVAEVRQVVRPRVLAGIKIGVGPQRVGVIDRDQVAFGIYPVAEISRALLHGGHGENRCGERASRPKSCHVEVEEGPPFLSPHMRDLEGTAHRTSELVLNVR